MTRGAEQLCAPFAMGRTKEHDAYNVRRRSPQLPLDSPGTLRPRLRFHSSPGAFLCGQPLAVLHCRRKSSLGGTKSLRSKTLGGRRTEWVSNLDRFTHRVAVAGRSTGY